MRTDGEEKAPGVAIRAARAEDFERVTGIYRRHVLEGTATFEIEPPSQDEMLRRWRDVTDRRLPWLVAETHGEVVGYGYAGVYRLRVAYRYTVEDSIYLDPAWTGRRIGRALLAQLLSDSERAGCRQVIAVIGDSANVASIGVHRALGFSHVGVLRGVGFKFGRWLDTVFMQRELGPGGSAAPDLSAGILGERA